MESHIQFPDGSRKPVIMQENGFADIRKSADLAGIGRLEMYPVDPDEGIVVFVDEEGLYKELESNYHVEYAEVIYGPAIVVATELVE